MRVRFNKVNPSGRKLALDGETALENEVSLSELCYHLSVASSLCGESALLLSLCSLFVMKR